MNRLFKINLVVDIVHDQAGENMAVNYGPEARVKISITLNWQIIIMLSTDNESGGVSECILVNMSIFLRKWCCYSALDTCFFSLQGLCALVFATATNT